MKKGNCLVLFFCFALIVLASCSKGYEVRFSNYYVEAMDSVIVGNNKVVFKNVAHDSTTEFNKISKGNYTVTFISKSKKHFSSALEIPKSGSGKRTLQIDGVNQISVLEE